MCMFQYSVALTACKDKVNPIPKHFKTPKISEADNVFCNWVDTYSIQNVILEMTS